MEFLEQYTSELVIGGSTTIGGFVIAILKGFSKKLIKIETKLSDLEKKIDINTALDKERTRRS